MTRSIVILYGPPASGKDTVTTELSRVDPEYRLFERLKAGPGRQDGYRMVGAEVLDNLRSTGELVWENSRYDARYAIDRTAIERAAESCVPVVHVGQPEAVVAVKNAVNSMRVVVVELHYDRREAAKRIEARSTGDLPARLAAWDATPRLTDADVRINTSLTTPHEAAHRIIAAVAAGVTHRA